jgi:hypothetical protein
MNSYAHMCRDGHIEIGFSNDRIADEIEMCVLCRVAVYFQEILDETPNPKLPYARRMVEIAKYGLNTIGADIPSDSEGGYRD